VQGGKRRNWGNGLQMAGRLQVRKNAKATAVSMQFIGDDDWGEGREWHAAKLIERIKHSFQEGKS